MEEKDKNNDEPKNNDESKKNNLKLLLLEWVCQFDIKKPSH